jgi:hypothetical protein
MIVVVVAKLQFVDAEAVLVFIEHQIKMSLHRIARVSIGVGGVSS